MDIDRQVSILHNLRKSSNKVSDGKMGQRLQKKTEGKGMFI